MLHCKNIFVESWCIFKYAYQMTCPTLPIGGFGQQTPPMRWGDLNVRYSTTFMASSELYCLHFYQQLRILGYVGTFSGMYVRYVSITNFLALGRLCLLGMRNDATLTPFRTEPCGTCWSSHRVSSYACAQTAAYILAWSHIC